ncbi:MAG: capsular biosynthesis protein [Myxococcales bacterium]|nr:capsular biosynthesis protein [Myxococcales bacterium]
MSKEHNIQPLPPGLDAPEEGLIPLREYWEVILKRIWLVVLVTIAVFALVAAYTFQLPKKYEARASLIIDMANAQVLGSEVQPVVEFSKADFWNSSQFFQTQYRIIKSRSLATKVVERLGLADDLVFLGLDKVKDEELKERLKEADPVERLMSITEVEPARETRIVTIAITHTDPKLAAKLANEMADVYRQLNVERKMESTYGAYNWLTSQYKDVKEKLEASDKALYDFKVRNNILSTSLEDRQNIISQRLIELNRQLNEIRGERIRMGAEADLVRQMRRGDLTQAASERVISNPLVQQLKASLTKLRETEGELSERYLDDHPELIAVRSQLKTIEKELNREIATILKAHENRLAVTTRSETGLELELEKAKREAFEVNQKELEYSQLVREQKNNSRLYELVLRRLKETDLSRLLKDNNIRVLDKALVPESPVLPRVPLNLALGLVLGLVLGLGVAFLLEMLDNTVKSQEDVEGYLGITFLGMVPRMKFDSNPGAMGVNPDAGFDSELYVHYYPKSTLAECCRTVRTNILFMSPDNNLDRILITSAGPLEGKTTTAANIATAMSQSNTRILLVDTDMRRPRLHKVFKTHNKVGLSSLLLGEATYEEAIQKTDVPNLDMIACGPIPPNPAELMHTERFLEILRNFAARYDRVIFDSPPTIAVTDSMILSNLVDGVIFVVQGGRTSKDIVRRALNKLKAVNAPLLGAVLNNVDLDSRTYGQYYYRYYRQYGQYYETDADAIEMDASHDASDGAS